MKGRWILGLSLLLFFAATGCTISDEDRCPADHWVYIKEIKMCCPSDHVYDTTSGKCTCPPGWSYGADGETCEPPASDTGDLDAGVVDGGGGDGTDTESCVSGLGSACTDNVTHTDCAAYCEKFCAWNPLPPASGRCTKEGCSSSADCPPDYACCDCTGSLFLQKAVVCMPPDWAGDAASLGGCVCN